MERNNKKRVFFTMLIVFLFLIASSIVIYNYSKTLANKEEIDNSVLFVKFYSSDIIEMTNKLPISDTLGKAINKEDYLNEIHGFVEFSIKNTSFEDVEYEIYLTKQKESGKHIKDNYLKFYLTDNYDNPLDGFDRNQIPTYSDFPYLNNKASSKLLYSGLLEKMEERKFKLRIWLSDSYSISDYRETFKVDVDVRVK